ncbi:MAG TPA: NADH-quinone oxidoreductase subunit L [Gaiellaceae bacterium]|nr:NADH-quinone oxidoreductase subunit L [Gaiellaceae bacterium]
MIAAGAWVCLLAPLAGFGLVALAGSRITRRQAGWTATLSVFVGFAGAVASFVAMLGEDPEERVHLTRAFTWLEAGSFQAGLELLVDPLAIVMMLIVSGVGGLIVWYSMGYMAGEDEERRFFAYMAFFVFSMLLLVQAGNLLLLLVGWGLVGLASYLLIGFYQQRPEAIAAAKKAFVMNTVGDATMALALFILIAEIGSVDYGTVFFASSNDVLSSTTLNLVALGLLGGAVAKSAQIPLHTWLPDAMEGPTPVSALIHAATMVVAGVYLICRLHPVFEAAPDVQHLAAVLGAITLLAAGVIALVQFDIKRVIAYSTMSQIGYMFLGAGIGAYDSAIFHLMTHAFFKALLFLAAGIVIHHLAGEQDIRRMGGLRASMPRTRIAFLVGTLALIGIPPLSGFWSKDGIVAAALARGGGLGWFLAIAGVLGALLTGAYAMRLYYRVFEGEESELVREAAAGHLAQAHGAEAGHAPAHGEAPRSMALPVGILTVLSAIGGLVVIPGVWHPFTDWLDTVFEPLVEPSVAQDYLTSVAVVAMGVVGIIIARGAFQTGMEIVPETSPFFRPLAQKLYFDELYDALFSRPGQLLAARLRDDVERPVVQGSLREIGRGAREAGGEVARVQSGLLRAYALAIAGSVVVLGIVFVAVR